MLQLPRSRLRLELQFEGVDEATIEYPARSTGSFRVLRDPFTVATERVLLERVHEQIEHGVAALRPPKPDSLAALRVGCLRAPSPSLRLKKTFSLPSG